MKLSRLLAVPVVALAMLFGQAVATPAQAAVLGAPYCKSDVSYNGCLRVNGTQVLNEWKFTAGQDAFMPQWYAQEIVNSGGPFSAQLYFENGNTDVYIGELTMDPGWPSAGATGLGMEFSGTFGSRVLNRRNGQEEFYAKVNYFDLHNGNWFTHETGKVKHDFRPWIVVDDK